MHNVLLAVLIAPDRPVPPWEPARRAWRRPAPPVALGLVAAVVVMAVVLVALIPLAGLVLCPIENNHGVGLLVGAVIAAGAAARHTIPVHDGDSRQGKRTT